ncbi:MAG TPA: hypothetical protein VG318_09485 [Actinomycetota bacterium]|nr:hypothetical protein [Actinomycetota bacterium]
MLLIGLVVLGALTSIPGLDASANPEKPPPPGAPFTGIKRYVSLLCRFGDDPSTPHPKEYYQELMGAEYPGQNHYWREVSLGKLDLQGQDVFGWYDMPQPRGYYFHEDGRTNGDKIRDDCTAAADADVHFPAYDGIIFWLNGSLSHLGHGGRLVLSRDGVEKNYGRVLMAEQEQPWGILAHEIGHGFDWRAHSSTGPCCDGDSSWDVMGSISFGCNTNWLPCIPVHPSAYRKLTAGWITVEHTYVAGPQQRQTIRLRSVSDPAPSGVLIAKVPIRGSSTRFYTIEARRQVGYDEGLLREGVLIHYIDTVEDHVWIRHQPDDSNDAGSGNWLTGDTFVDQENGISIAVGAGDPVNGFDVTIETPAWDPPPNDDPAGAITIQDPGTFTHSVYTDLATVSASEPIVSCTGDRPTNSVWYEVTPSKDGWFSFTTLGSDYEIVYAIYEGAPGSSNEIRCGFDYGWIDSPYGADGLHEMPLKAGTTYTVGLSSLGWNNGGALDVSTKFSESAGPLPPPGGGPRGPVDHATSVGLRLDGHLLAVGRVSVADGSTTCLDEVLVRIQRKRTDGWRTNWTVTTTPDGGYRTPLVDRAGRYRAVVPEATIGDHHCLRAQSIIRRHQHT